MSNAYDYITIDAGYRTPGIMRGADTSEHVSAFLKHPEDADLLKTAVKKYISYAFKKGVKMTFNIAAGYLEVYAPQARLYHIEIDCTCLDTETVAVYTCDRFGSCNDDTKTVYGRRAACKFITGIIDGLKTAYDADLPIVTTA
jgi:hypothetical protein